jgi:G3E family GTPase
VTTDSDIKVKTATTLLTGFLGSGKTTLLNHIALAREDMSDTVILVNEFGRLGIDGTLLKGGNNEVIELTNGCICCSLAVDLRKTLIDISNRFDPRFILIEASGVADPRSICQVFNHADIRELMLLERTFAVLDADVWKMRSIMGSLFFLQMQAADVILVNKIDLLDSKAILQVINEIHHDYPQAQVLSTIYCRVDPVFIFFTTEQTKERPRELKVHGLNDFYALNPLRHPTTDAGCPKAPVKTIQGYVAFSFLDTRAMHPEAFDMFIAALPIEMFRIKGPVHFQDKTVLFNHAGGKSDWSTWKGSPETRLAFVGWNINPEETIRALRECLMG